MPAHYLNRSGYCDFGDICRLRRLVGWDEWPADEQSILDSYITKEATFTNDQLVGWAGSVQLRPGRVMLVDLMVDPGHRHRGIASELIALTSWRLSCLGIRLIDAVCRPSQRRLFEISDFQVCDDPAWHDLVRLEKALDQAGIAEPGKP